ncbi:MAG: DUF3343 domain-containing protein [Nitrososphaerota archaeon]|jgi:hypothetical protein|nr:DUF3343 domain-containing protein [Nitrososphaerota archaeon]
MKWYIVTFYSHFGALSYYKVLKDRGINAKMLPVPRKISSSCGTCVCYENDLLVDLDGYEIDCVYLKVNDALECILKK